MIMQSKCRASGRRWFCLAISAIALFTYTRAEAVITTFTNRTAWTTAASTGGTVQIEGFESLPTGGLPAGSNQLGLVNLNITLQPGTTTTGASIGGSPAINGIRDLILNADEAFRIYEVTFGGPISAFGFDFAGASTGGDAVLRADGQTFPFGDAGSGFFGIVSTTPIPSVFFADEVNGLPTEIFDSDQYSFVIIPEPASAMLLAPAALLMLRRRIK